MGYVALNSNPLAKPVFNPIRNGRIVGMDFSRASEAWDYSDPDLQLSEFADDIPRLGYEPGYVENGKGVLINEEVTHLARRNAEVRSGSFWSVGRVSTANTGTEGSVPGSTISQIMETVDNNTHLLLIDPAYRIAMTSGTTYTIACRLRKGVLANAPDWIQLRYISATHPTNYANFNLSTGVAGNVAGGTSSIYDMEDGSYLCIFHSTANATADGSPLIAFTDNTDAAGVVSYAGSTTADVLVDYLDCYEGNQLQPYALTLDDQVTILQDTLYTNEISKFSLVTGCTLYSHLISHQKYNTGNEKLFNISDGTISNRIFYDLAENQLVLQRGGVSEFNIDGANISYGEEVKLAISCSENEFRLVVNSNLIGSATGFTFPAGGFNEMYVGQEGGGLYPCNFRGYNFSVFNRAWSQSEMEKLTSL